MPRADTAASNACSDAAASRACAGSSAGWKLSRYAARAPADDLRTGRVKRRG